MRLLQVLSIIASVFVGLQTFAQSNIPSYVPSSGLVGYWPFNGNANDESGNGNNGVVHGATLTPDRNGNTNSAYSFDGVDDNIGLGNFFNYTSFSISMWVKPGNQNGHAVIIDNNHASSNNWVFQTISNFANNGYNFINSNEVLLSTFNWNHVTLSYSSGVVRVYLNANLVSETQWPLNYNNSPSLFLGYWQAANARFWKGDMDDIGIWNRALTQQEISNLYSICSTIPSVSITNQTICQGLSTTLTATPSETGGTYLWSTGETTQSITVNPTSDYAYSVNYSLGSCPVATQNATVSVLDATITASDTLICAGGNVTLSSGGGAGANLSGLSGSVQNGLVGYWPFNGNANDESGNGNNGTVYGATNSMNISGAYYFDGNSNYIALESPFFNGATDVSNFTYFTRLKISQYPNPNQAYSISNKEGYWRTLALEISSDGTIGFGGSQPNQYLGVSSQPSAIVLNEWCEIFVTFENSELKIYVNGNLAGSSISPFSTLDFSWPAMGNSTSTNLFGAAWPVSPGLTYFFNGYIDEFAVWDRSLSTIEMQQLSTSQSYLWSTGDTTATISVNPTQTTTYYVTVSNGFSTCTDSLMVTVNNISQNLFAQDTIAACGSSYTLNASLQGTSYNWNTGASTPSVNISTTGLYKCTVSQGTCAATDSVFVSLVNADIVQGDTSVCSGATVQFTVNGNCNNVETGNAQWQLLIPGNSYLGDEINFNPNGFNPLTQTWYSVLKNGSTNRVYAFNLSNNTVTTLPSNNGPGELYSYAYDRTNDRLIASRVGRVAVYTLPINGGSWQQIGAGGGDDESYGSNAFWNPISNRFTYFGGYGYYTTKNWIWENNGQGWINPYPNNNDCNPARRVGNGIAPSANGDKIYIFSGQGSCNGDQFASSCSLGSPWPTDVGVYCWLKDIWELDLSNYQFTNVLPVNNQSITREGSFAFDHSNNAFYLIGGSAPTSAYGVYTPTTMDVSRFRRGVDAGFSNITVSGTAPSADRGGTSIYDATGNRIIYARNDGIWAINFGNSCNVTYLWSTGDTTATISVSPTQTTTYYVTVSNGISSCMDSVTVVVNSNTTPTFTAVAPICSGATLSPLSTISNNGITGTWSPALSNTATTTYTFTPDTSQCAISTTLAITVNPSATATITAGGATTFCSGGSVVLSANTGTGFTFVWKKNGTTITGATAATYTATTTGSYSVTVTNSSSCSATASAAAVTVNALPTATITAGGATTFCSGSSVVLNANTGTGLTYVWRKNGTAIIGATNATYTATTAGSYTVVTTNSNGCSRTSTAAVVSITASTTPIFTAVAPICSGVTLNALPTSSINGITGTWSPALNNTATTTYTFTPTSGLCASSTTMSIAVNALPTAIVTVGGSSSICIGSSVVLSTNTGTGLTYIWKNNGTVIAGATTEMYTANTAGSYTVNVTNANGCSASSSATTVSTINTSTPIFTQVGPYFSGASIPALGTTSTNGISGTWSPAINNTATTTYTFTPSAGQCASTTTMTIIVNQPFQYNLTATDSSVCAGTTVTLSVNIHGTYRAGTVHCNGTPTAVVDVTNPLTGKVWMDRNLGASQVATSSSDPNAYGDLYQWGRRSDGHQCRTSTTTATLSSVDQPSHGNFITNSTTPGDWRSPQNTNLWQGVNGVNNPCPSGYRLPTEIELDAERSSWSQNNNVGAFASPLKLPMAGYRYHADGSLATVGSYGLYWSSKVSSTNSHTLGFVSSSAYMTPGARSYGLSVRCLKN